MSCWRERLVHTHTHREILTSITTDHTPDREISSQTRNIETYIIWTDLMPDREISSHSHTRERDLCMYSMDRYHGR